MQRKIQIRSSLRVLLSELRRSAKVEVAVLGSPSLTVLMVSSKKKKKKYSTHKNWFGLAVRR